MKIDNPARYAIAVLTASVLLMNSPFVSAQNANRQNRQEAGQGRRGGGLGAMQNLSEEQRTALQQMNQETREQARAVNEARTELNNAIFAEKVDEGKIKEKAAAVAKLEAELAVARAKAFAKIRSKFTSEQIETLKNSPALGRGLGGGARRQGGG